MPSCSQQHNRFILPQAHSQHRFQKLFDVLLDTGSHGSCQHTNAGEDCGINLHRLLPPGKEPHNHKELLFFKHLSSSHFCVISLTEALLIFIQEFDPTLQKLYKEQGFPFLPQTFHILTCGQSPLGEELLLWFQGLLEGKLETQTSRPQKANPRPGRLLFAPSPSSHNWEHDSWCLEDTDQLPTRENNTDIRIHLGLYSCITFPTKPLQVQNQRTDIVWHNHW